MKQIELVSNRIKLVLKEDVLAVISSEELNIVSSAIYKGGCQRSKHILNMQVLDDFSDLRLHSDPLAFILETSKKLAIDDDFVGMVTYAAIEDFSLFSMREDELSVSVIATAGCTHAESAGERISVQPIEGTINIIVLIDGNPVSSCLVSSIITATEAKTAALRELDVRSLYSGSEATGTITDAIVVAKTGRGPPIAYSGPASQLGQLIGSCTKNAVKEAVMKAKVGGYVPCRSIQERLREQHLSIEKLASELAKAESLNTDKKTIATTLAIMIGDKPIFASLLFAAIKISEDMEKALIPPQFGEINVLGKKFGKLLSKQAHIQFPEFSQSELDAVNLPPFLKQVLLRMVWIALSETKSENI